MKGDKRLGSQVLGWTKVWAGYGRDAKLLSLLLEGQRRPRQRDHEIWGFAQRPVCFPLCLCTRNWRGEGPRSASGWAGCKDTSRRDLYFIYCSWNSVSHTRAIALFLLCFSTLTFPSCHHPMLSFLTQISFQFPRTISTTLLCSSCWSLPCR